MKKLFLSSVVLIVASMSYAQSNLVATLSHNGEVSVFHGSNSLKDAMAVADHGDIITLASGRYNAANITKAITLRGAGIEADDTGTGAARTQIIGSFDINIPDNISKTLTIEGIYHEEVIVLTCKTLHNVILQKCRFGKINFTYFDTQIVNSLTCISCNIANGLAMAAHGKGNYINCVINTPSNGYWGYYGGNVCESVTEFTNCIITGNIDRVVYSYLQNCILNVSGKLPNNNTATYCVGYTSDNPGSPFANLTSQATNKVLTQEQINTLFKPNTFYELTDEAKNKYVGIDDKEIGIYGGNLPYETLILSPQITKCNVAAKTTADGKLSVDIEVKAAE